MAYHICYGLDRPQRLRFRGLRWGIALVLGVILFVGSAISQDVTTHTQTWFTVGQLRRDETALKHMAQKISMGEGWYASAVGYCREIMALSED